MAKKRKQPPQLRAYAEAREERTAGRLGLRAYARRRARLGLPGGTLSSVQKAIAEGRIGRSCPEHARCPDGCSNLGSGIDALVADQDWLDSTASKEATSSIASVTAARAAHELYKARMARLRYEKACGNLVEVADVRAERLRAGKAVRDAMFAMARRAAGSLSGMTDKRRIQEYLEDEVRRALDRTGRTLRITQ